MLKFLAEISVYRSRKVLCPTRKTERSIDERTDGRTDGRTDPSVGRLPARTDDSKLNESSWNVCVLVRLIYPFKHSSQRREIEKRKNDRPRNEQSATKGFIFKYERPWPSGPLRVIEMRLLKGATGSVYVTGNNRINYKDALCSSLCSRYICWNEVRGPIRSSSLNTN